MIEIYFDGLCEPINPNGVATYGFVIYQDTIYQDVICIKKEGKVIGEGKGMTNNVAEYTALIKALEWLDTQDIHDRITIYGDSKLVINQVNGLWKVKSETSKKYVPVVRDLIKNKDVRLKWIPREKNSEADTLSGEAYEIYTREKRIVR